MARIILGGAVPWGDICFLASRAYRSAKGRLKPVHREAKGGYFGGYAPPPVLIFPVFLRA